MDRSWRGLYQDEREYACCTQQFSQTHVVALYILHYQPTDGTCVILDSIDSEGQTNHRYRRCTEHFFDSWCATKMKVVG